MMVERWFEELKAKVESFILESSNKELNDAFERAGFDFYSKIDTPIFREAYGVCDGGTPMT